MARAEAVEPSVAKRLLLSGFKFPRNSAVSGHARLLARPAYQRLLAAEPLLLLYVGRPSNPPADQQVARSGTVRDAHLPAVLPQPFGEGSADLELVRRPGEHDRLQRSILQASET